MMIQDNPVLTSLGLMGCGLRPEEISKLCGAIIKNPVLTSLDLSVNMFRGQSITSLRKMFITSSIKVDTGSGFVFQTIGLK